MARDAYLPGLVAPERLVSANARLRGGEAASEGAGFGVGGWLVQILGAPHALLVDAATFVASAGLLARIRAPEPPPVPRARPRGAHERLREAGEGLRFVFGHPQLAPLAAATALLLGAWQVTSVVYLLFLDELGFAAGWLGVVFAAGSLSSLLGATAAGAAGRRLGPRRSMSAGLAVLGSGMLLVPLVPGPGVLGFALLVAQQLGDCGEVVFQVHQSSLRQSLPPAELRARVNAGFGFLAQGAMLAGTALGALAGETLGSRPTLLLGAAGILLAAMIVGRGRSGDGGE